MEPRTQYDLLQWDEQEDFEDWYFSHDPDDEDIADEIE